MYKLTREQARMRRLAGLNRLVDDQFVEIIEAPAPEPVSAESKLLNELECRRALEGMGDVKLSEAERRQLLELRRGGSESTTQTLLERNRQRYLAGLISEQQFYGEKDRILTETESSNVPKMVIDDKSLSPKERRAKLWEAHYRGEISLDETLERTAQIRLLEEEQPKLLTEQKHDCGEGCKDCHLGAFREQLDGLVASGHCTVEQADKAFTLRCRV